MGHWERRRAVLGLLEIARDAMATASAMMPDDEEATVELSEAVFQTKLAAHRAIEKVPPLEAPGKGAEVNWRAPQWLYTLHYDIVIRKYDGRGMRWRDHAALAVVRWILNRLELMQKFGVPWLDMKRVRKRVREATLR